MRFQKSIVLPKNLKPLIGERVSDAQRLLKHFYPVVVDVQYEDAAVAQMVINQLGDRLKITNKRTVISGIDWTCF